MYNTSEALDNPTSFTYYYPAPKFRTQTLCLVMKDRIQLNWLKEME